MNLSNSLNNIMDICVCIHEMAPLLEYASVVRHVRTCPTSTCDSILYCLSVCLSVRLDTHTTKVTDGLMDIMSNFLDQLLELSIEHHKLSILVPRRCEIPMGILSACALMQLLWNRLLSRPICFLCLINFSSSQ